MDSFDDICNNYISDFLQLEMALKRVKKLEDFKADPSHAKYSIFDVSGKDKELAQKIVTAAVKRILDDLDQYPNGIYPGRRTDYQDKIATFIRQAINEVIPDSEKPTKKPFTARDFYAVREIAKALRDQGIVIDDPKENNDNIKSMDNAQKAEVAAEVADHPKVQRSIKTVVNQQTNAGSDKKSEHNKSNFDLHATYSIASDFDSSSLDKQELRALQRIDDGMTGTEIVNSLKTSIALRDYPELIKPMLQKLVAIKALIKQENKEGDIEDMGPIPSDDPNDVASDLGVKVPKHDPYSGASQDY